MGLGWQELLIVLFIVLLLFGSTKLPQLMRSLGQGVGEFKTGMKEPPVHDDEHDEEETKQA
ncbi:MULTISPECIES: Sec-independent protein translocase subunit TatA/TatB [Blastopirellula]|uniref:Sec-independent protein translocase protein TatA n=1 Tax=Blastopirellula marina DSM 3645 TaxID=314230 RepID=A4A0D8_9BACT|nr:MULTISPECIES: twin-arginine translocase TatA/TatE family subunit [Blastopirellula]EAQ77758.1 hypothetical protein DSM3645_25352 [Blastopirellula marina DSM 3645]UUO09023.1 twin-arginine translocase TatA/TatE family subunit [Blastopirellula sp. J2-11]